MNNLYCGPSAPLLVDSNTKTTILQVHWKAVGGEKIRNGFEGGALGKFTRIW